MTVQQQHVDIYPGQVVHQARLCDQQRQSVSVIMCAIRSGG